MNRDMREFLRKSFFISVIFALLMAAVSYNLKKLLKWISKGLGNDQNSLVRLFAMLWRILLQFAGISASTPDRQQIKMSVSITQLKTINTTF